MGLQMQQLDIKHSDKLTDLLQTLEFVGRETFMGVCRNLSNDVFKVRHANEKLKLTPEAELLVWVIGESFSQCRNSQHDIDWFFNDDSAFVGYCNVLGINVNALREILSRVNKHVFIYQFKKKERENAENVLP